MSFKSSDPATSIVTAVSWGGLAVFSFWLAWAKLSWWFAVPLGLMLGLVALGYAIESIAQELTVRRWAISQLVFTVFGLSFAAAGIFGGIDLPGWLLWVGAGVFILSAVLCAMAAKELF